MTPRAAAPSGPALALVLVGARLAWERFASGQALDRALEAAQLALAPAADARMGGAVRDVVSNAVRRRAVVEFVLARLAQRAPDPAVAALLAVSLAQLLAGTYSDFTLVDQAVRAARQRPETAAAGGFINAVLREYLRRADALLAEALQDPARRFNVPSWWLRRVRRQHGAAAEAMLAAQLEEPPLVLRVNRRRATRAQVLESLAAAGMPALALGPASVWLQRAVPVERIPGFAAGQVSVQDAGAQLAAPWLDVQPGMRVLDACAAPGGKTAHVLELADCDLDAVESDRVRAARIHENLVRLGLQARVVVADVLQPDDFWQGIPYQRILLDAPCTASGVVRRHPDAVWLRREADVAKLATQQRKMLDALWPLLAPAGRLLYVVCSVFAEEGQRQVAAFLGDVPGARLCRLPAGDASGLQLLPTSVAAVTGGGQDSDGLPELHDGFYYALLEKT